MKKFFTLIATAFVAMAANAQLITFPVGGSVTEWSNGDFKITATDEANKIAVDANSTYFGTANEYVKYESRMKSGGKSSSKLMLTLTIPTDGTLKIAARTGSNSATDRNIILSQDGADILDKILLESEAAKVMIGEEEKSVYPVLSAPVKAGTATITFPVGSVNFYAFELVAGGSEPTPGGDDQPSGETETYTAISWDGTAYTVAPEFLSIAEDPTKGGIATNAKDGLSVVNFGTANMTAVGVSGTNPKDVQETAAGVFPGWINGWGDVKWDYKNQGDIKYAYIQGSGNPYVEINSEAVITDGEPTGMWRPTYVYYGPKEETVNDKSYKKSLPVNGTYFKFTPKTNGKLCVKMWANKGNHNTFVMEESTLELISYTVEGYINGQNEVVGKNEDGSDINAKKWLSNDEIKAIHDASSNAENPYVIGAGNQPFWGNIIINVEAGKTYWLLQASSQIGFQGYEFTVADGIQDVIAAPAAKVMKTIKNGKIVIINGNNTYNVAGQLVK